MAKYFFDSQQCSLSKKLEYNLDKSAIQKLEYNLDTSNNVIEHYLKIETVISRNYLYSLRIYGIKYIVL